MKLFKLILIFIIPCLAFSQANIDSTIVKNKVKEIRIFDSNNNLVANYIYNIKGQLLYRSMDNFTSSVFLKTSQTNNYNEKGLIIKSISTHSSFDKPTIWINEYDTNDNLAIVKDENGNLIFQFFYDNTNFKTKELMYEEGKIAQTTTYEKFDNGKKIIQFINGDFLKNRKNISFFDDNKNEIKNESYNSGKLSFTTISTYKQNRILKTTFNETNTINGENYFYDSKYRLIKRELFNIINKKEIPDRYESFEYSDNDLITKYSENIYSINGLNNYHYEYDFYK